jgi:hypothetical protein
MIPSEWLEAYQQRNLTPDEFVSLLLGLWPRVPPEELVEELPRELRSVMLRRVRDALQPLIDGVTFGPHSAPPPSGYLNQVRHLLATE